MRGAHVLVMLTLSSSLSCSGSRWTMGEPIRARLAPAASALGQKTVHAALEAAWERDAKALEASSREALAAVLGDGPERGPSAQRLSQGAESAELIAVPEAALVERMLTKVDAGAQGQADAAVDPEAEGDAEEAPVEDGTKDLRPRLASINAETWIFAEPSKKSRKVGYLRGGAVVARSERSVGNAGCKGGWYKVEPRGFVCHQKGTTFDVFHPVVEALRRRPKRDGLPYDYVMSRTPGPAFYTRLPTDKEMATVEPDLKSNLRKVAALKNDPSFVPLPEPGPMPPALLYGQSLPRFSFAPPLSQDALISGRAGVRSGFALLSQFDHEGRRFGVTTDLSVIPLDRTRWMKQSEFHGLALSEELPLPVAFVMKKRATRYARDEKGPMRATEATTYREAIALTGEAVGDYLEARDGSYVRREDVRVVEPLSRPPVWAKEGKRWIDVSILKQSLVAYEGTVPKYVTLVSTGRDGLRDPKETHSTVQGAFLIHTKHVSVTMDGDETGDEFDLRDVPFVQYFNEGYALHAAYWHDDFGTPRSHGCVNLAPVDAAWLFGFTTPDVPSDWHGALSLKGGTVVFTHP